MNAQETTANATVALVVCAALQLVVLGLQWRTLAGQGAFQKDERDRTARQALERARLMATFARRSLLETQAELDRMIARIGEVPSEKFANMAAGLATVEMQLRQAHEYLTEVSGADLTQMNEAVTCFLRAADRVNRLGVAPEHMGDAPTPAARRASAQDARENVRRAIVHLETAARLTPNHTQ